MTILTDALNWGEAMPATVRYRFEPGGASVPGPYGAGQRTDAWSAYEQRQFEAALGLFETVCDVEFVETGSAAAADFRLYSFDGEDDGILGAFHLPYGGTSTGWFSNTGTGWDGPGGGLEQGGYGFVTIIHELGHGLGLEHPHDGSGRNFPGVTSAFGDYGDFDLNQGVYTTMSYNDGWQTAPQGLPASFDYGYQGTPMAIDIAVLQDLYGVNDTYRTGNDVYTLPTANASGTFYSCIWDAGGIDTIQVGRTGRDAIVDLNDATLLAEEGGGGFVSYAEGIHGGFTIANGAAIENATGSLGDDSLKGNALDNVLNGSMGDDSLFGGGGRDVLIGAIGADRLAGGGQSDVFVFRAVRDSTAGKTDLIVDFTVRDDDIDLSNVDWSAAAGDQAFTLVAGPLTAAGQVRVRRDTSSGDTFVEAEVDGAAGADLRIRLDGLLTLGEADFVL